MDTTIPEQGPRLYIAQAMADSLGGPTRWDWCWRTAEEVILDLAARGYVIRYDPQAAAAREEYQHVYPDPD